MRLFFLILLFISIYTNADKSPAPYVKLTASDNGKFYFLLHPAKREWQSGEYKVISDAFGMAFRVLPDGSGEKMWETSGWYAFRVYLSHDGKYLARVTTSPFGSAPDNNDSVVAFYENGKLLREYSSKELVKDAEKIERSVSHYYWTSNNRDLPKIDYADVLQIETIENRLYSFDMKTGDILK
jgi:hypothetical protein